MTRPGPVHTSRYWWCISLTLCVSMSDRACADELNKYSVTATTKPVTPGPPMDQDRPITWTWLLLQMLPSPGASFSSSDVQFHMSWQATPLLYSWSLQPGLVPWRSLVVEPSARQAGSVELFTSPEYFGGGSRPEDHWGVRVGVRSYFPLYARGEYLSWSLGTAYAYYAGQHSVSYEAGLYVLFGVLGLVGSYNPGFVGDEVITSVRVRYF